MTSPVRRVLPQLVTSAVLVLLYAATARVYPGFFSLRGILNLFTDNAALGIAAVGLTLVIFSGGIDLSVGATAGFTSIFVATIVEQHHVNPIAAVFLALLVGAIFGAIQGALIQFFAQPAFLITLAGMFLMRGCAFWITTESVGLTNPLLMKFSAWEIPIGAKAAITAAAVCLLGTFFIGIVIAQFTRFGRNLLAIGGNEQSALLMGLPIARTRIAVYALNSTIAAFAGLVLMLYTGSGNPSFGLGLELDAIAVTVIGGTLLGGGRGSMVGTFLGLMIFGVIQAALIYDGRLSPAWSRIAVGILLLAFILLQRGLLARFTRR